MLEVIRARKLHEQAGAYYVRIQAMARQHHITLREEFDEHDGPECNYIVVLDHDFPVATCRWFPVETGIVEIGRVVVLPEYRGKDIGRLVVGKAEEWISEEGYEKIVISSRDVAVGFYEKLGYQYNPEHKAHSDTFHCVYMEKNTIG